MLHFLKLYEAVLLCLSKVPDWSNKELNSKQEGRRKDRWGWQAERINGRRETVERMSETKRRGGHQGTLTQHTTRHGVRHKESHTE